MPGYGDWMMPPPSDDRRETMRRVLRMYRTLDDPGDWYAGWIIGVADVLGVPRGALAERARGIEQALREAATDDVAAQGRAMQARWDRARAQTYAQALTIARLQAQVARLEERLSAEERMAVAAQEIAERLPLRR